MLESIGHYRILERLGAGGMGEVYRARDTRLGRTVAVKVLPASVAEDAERRERFLREARATAALSHPNIAALFEIGEQDGQLYLVFEYVPGQTLRAVIGEQPLNPRRAIDLAAQVADALAEAHSLGIVHRDIKPDNIIVTPKGPVKVLDFGLATWTAGGAMRDVHATQFETTPGLVLGTVAYMSPEQAQGEAVDHRSDIFSLGVVLYEMLTGRTPFAAATPTATLLQIMQSEPPMPSTVNAGIPIDCDTIVSGMLAKSVQVRYDNAAEVAGKLRDIATRLDARQTRHAVAEPRPLPPRVAARKRIALTPLVAIAAAIALAWVFREQGRAVWNRLLGSPPPPVLAVVPLEPQGQESETYFADGLTEDLITRLGQIPGVRVLGRSATRAHRGRDPREVAGELGAAVVLTGSVRQQAGDVRVTVELIDPGTGTQLWTNQFTRPLRDVFAVQNEIAEQVARELRVTLAPSAARARTASRLVDARAYDAYLRARDATARRELPKAIELYAEAVRIDPGLVEAQAGLAEALYLEITFYGYVDDAPRWARVRQAAALAVAADPDLPLVQVAAGLAARKLAESLDHLRRASELDASFGDVYHQTGDLILEFDPERAIGMFRRSLQVDPQYEVNQVDIVVAYLLLDRPTDAAAANRAGETRFPGRPWWAAGRALLQWRQGDARSAVDSFAVFLRALPLPMLRLLRARSLVDAGRSQDALAEVQDIVRVAPYLCEARAVLAGLQRDAGAHAVARELAGAIFATAERPDAPRASARCAATAAAALADGAAAARWLRTMAGDEEALRLWALQINGASGVSALRWRWYPWGKVAGHPLVAAAERDLERAYEATRQEIARVLTF